VLGGLFVLDATRLRTPTPAPKGGKPFREGLGFVWRDRVLRDTFIVLLIVSTLVFNYNVSLLLLSSRVLHGGAGAFGLMLSITSLGSCFGSLVVASRQHVGTRMMVVMLVLLGGFSVLLALTSSLTAAVLLSIPVGIGGAGYVAATNSIILPRTPPAMRGRVLALQATAFLGSAPIGGPITGWIGDHFGARWSVAYGGLAALVCAAGLVAFVRDRRRVLVPAVLSLSGEPGPPGRSSLA
jgi:MFS family permease